MITIDTLTLRSPDFGNGWSTYTGAIVRANHAQQLRGVRDTDWPIIEGCNFTISAVSKADKDALIEFILDNAGLEWTLIDQEGREWQVIITEDPTIVQTGRGCQYQITLKLEGYLTSIFLPS